MSTDNLFPDQAPPKKRGILQQELLNYLRTGKTITEAIYRKEIEGRSVSAAINNLKSRGHFEPGEFVIHEKVRDSHGAMVPGYRLAKESPIVDTPRKETEIEDIPEWPEVGEGEEPPVLDHDTPEVSSIVVGVKGHYPELIIMFKGDFKPLRHVMTQTEVRYLLTNLMTFIPKPQE